MGPRHPRKHTTLVAFIQKKNFNRKHLSARQNNQDFNTQPLAEIEFQEETKPYQGPEQENTKERDGVKKGEQSSTCREAFTLRKCIFGKKTHVNGSNPWKGKRLA